MAKKKNSLRIIGGKWRSRRIQFVEVPEIRPTPDRVRETLFNWLAGTITGAACLDLFAGSGALGFEAASRGAGHVTQVEINKAIAAVLTEQKNALAAQQVEIVQQDALAFLQQCEQKFALVFLDPPFNSNLLQAALKILVARQLIAPSGLLYIESAKQSAPLACLDEFRCRHEKVAGQVRYTLYQHV